MHARACVRLQVTFAAMLAKLERVPRLTSRAVLLVAVALGLTCAACESCTPTGKKAQTAQGDGEQTGMPDARLYFVSDLAGQLEPCGCVKDQPGGLDHLAAALRKDKASVPSAFFAVGPTRVRQPFERMSASEKPQRVREWRAIDGALSTLDLNAECTPPSEHTAPGGLEAKRGTQDLDSDVATVFSVGPRLLRVGVLRTAPSLSESEQEVALRKALQAPRKEAADVWVVLSSRGRGEAKRLAERLPELAAVAIGRSELESDDNTEGFAPEQVGKTWILEPANHGQQVAVLDVWSRPNRMAARNLDVRDSAGSDPAVLAIMREMDKDSNAANAQQFASVLPAKAASGQASYVGAQVCAGCHADATKVWQGTAHSHAYATLESKHKNFNLDCVGCHVTGYDKPGGSNVTHVEGLKNVQCENCHGPASLHVAAPGKVRPPVPHPDAAICTGCHHPPHVKSFDFGAMVPHILGPGHGAPRS